MKSLLGAVLLLTSLSSKAALTIGTYNIRNFDYDTRSRVPTNKNELSKIIKSLGVDVLSIEEINNTARFEDFVAKNLPGYDTELSRCGGAHGQHVGFLFNEAKVELLSFTEDLRITNPGSSESCNTGSRPLALAIFKIKATNQKFIAATAHLKSGSDPEAMRKRYKQYEIIKAVIKEYQGITGVKDFYIGGDLNSTEYLARGTDYQSLNKMVSDLAAKDLSANLACTAYWWGNTDDGIETPSLLDHLIVSPGLLKTSGQAQIHGHCQKVSCKQASLMNLGISYAEISDHCPVTATIQ